MEPLTILSWARVPICSTFFKEMQGVIPPYAAGLVVAGFGGVAAYLGLVAADDIPHRSI